MDEFAELVGRMRNAQKMYLRVRTPDLLDKARKLEQQVDAKLKEFAKWANGQMSLFEE